MASLEEPIDIGDVSVSNRLYRAPLLECAGTGSSAVDRLLRELRPAAASGVGLICQGATIVRESGGCAAPNMTRVHDPSFVSSLDRLTEAVHSHGGRLFLQLEHGGLRSLETWHRGYRSRNPSLEQLAVSEPPRAMRVLDRIGVLEMRPHVLSTDEVYELAADFGRSASYAIDAGYDGIHIAGANMGIVQQFLSPYYNKREDEFGGSLTDRVRFLEVVHDEIRDRVGSVPIITKVPAETPSPPWPIVTRSLDIDDGVSIAARLDAIGFDAIVPTLSSVFWDMSIARGEYPKRAWEHADLRSAYDEAFGGPWRRQLLALGNRIQARIYGLDPCWNEPFCRAVREAVTVPVLAEGGIRRRSEMDRLLGESDQEPACDMVGLGRPFYAEPKLGARLLEEHNANRHGVEERRVLCESCNNCVVPQATGARGRCRTPAVLKKRVDLEREGRYD